jgi:hypothetical protein
MQCNATNSSSSIQHPLKHFPHSCVCPLLPGTASTSFLTGTLPLSPCATCTGLGAKFGCIIPTPTPFPTPLPTPLPLPFPLPPTGVLTPINPGNGACAGLWSNFCGIVLPLSGHGPLIPSAATPLAADESGAGGAAPLLVGVWKRGGGAWEWPLLLAGPEGVAWRGDWAKVCEEARGRGRG